MSHDSFSNGADSTSSCQAFIIEAYIPVACPVTAFFSCPAQGVSYPIQNGCHLSRASIRRFRHNDMADLERVLQEVDKEYRRLRCGAALLSLWIDHTHSLPSPKVVTFDLDTFRNDSFFCSIATSKVNKLHRD